jgi:hypothetical protein
VSSDFSEKLQENLNSEKLSFSFCLKKNPAIRTLNMPSTRWQSTDHMDQTFPFSSLLSD